MRLCYAKYLIASSHAVLEIHLQRLKKIHSSRVFAVNPYAKTCFLRVAQDQLLDSLVVQNHKLMLLRGEDNFRGWGRNWGRIHREGV
jgi:hypothetical protein